MYLQLFFVFVASAYSRPSVTKQNHTCYKCLAEQCFQPLNQTCVTQVGCYTSLELVENEFLFHQRGCFIHPLAALVTCSNEFPHIFIDVSICCKGDFCNNHEFPSMPDHWTSSTESTTKQLEIKPTQGFFSNSEIKPTQGFFSNSEIKPTQGFFSKHNIPVFIVMAICCICYVSYKLILKTIIFSSCCRNPAPNATCDNILSPGSGSGMLTLNQRCLAQDVTLIKCIGQGRYGAVFQGVYHGEYVAVKIIPTKDEASWQNEVDIYTNIALYHENVLGFKGSVITMRSTTPEMWLLTAFHERGSLYDYLLENTITLNEMMDFVRSICSGLLHLHMEIVGSKGKPSIAHRDLKTRNILLTSHGTCVIADFGLAVVKTDKTPSTDRPINYQVGTKRYMAPEILDNSIKTNTFDSFKRADIYAFGLILWEVCSRVNQSTTQTYRLPFHDCVPSNPDFEDMKKVVCIELKRPEIPDNWLSNQILNTMATLMKECWHKTPEIRPTVFRVKKTLDKIYAEMQALQSIVHTI